MAKDGRLSAAARDLQTLFEVGALGGLSDGELLDRFVARREGPAFEALVRRHGPMVWGVCRRVLRDHHDAEDVFQATFLVLARKAASVQPREKVGHWLHGVACRTAMKVRATRGKRRGREGQLLAMPEPGAVPVGHPDDLLPELDRELSRLPERYRVPIILCELEGMTHREAAEQLGWPIGTVSGRLSRARAILAKRLSRHGAMFPGGSLAVRLARDGASAGMPNSAVFSTIQAACPFAAGRAATAGVVSAEVAALAEGALKVMLLSKIKVVSTILLATALIGAGLWQAEARPDAGEKHDDVFQATVDEVIRDERTIVARVGIGTLPGARVAVIADKADRGGFSGTASSRPDGTAHTEILIFADHVEWEAGSTNALKFMMNFKSGAGAAGSSNTGPMPDGKRLADVVAVAIVPGEYKFGGATKLVTFKDVTYRVVVSKPE